MARTKKVQTTIKSMEEADQVLKEIALLENQKMKVDSWATEREQVIRDEAKMKLVINDKTGETVNDRIASLSANLLAFVDTKRDTFSIKKRSMELLHGTVGFRLGTPKVTTIGSMTQKAIITTEAIFQKLKKWGWIEQKPRLDKNAILASYTNEKDKTVKRLKQVSLNVEQTDEPWFETRRVDVNAVSQESEMKLAS